MVFAVVAAPESEYMPQPENTNGSATSRNEAVRLVADREIDMALFFKFVFFYFAIQCSLGNPQIACRIFTFVVIFS